MFQAAGWLSERGLEYLIQATWQAGVLGLLVLVVTTLLRDRLQARWRFALWLVVLVRFAIPVVPSAPWGWAPFSIVPVAIKAHEPSIVTRFFSSHLRAQSKHHR